MKIESDLFTLQRIADDRLVFNVPIYQRLYVWGTEQIDTLLEDLFTAYQQGKSFFYLGGTLVVAREDATGTCFDLIDGQQRFTTLWMMSLAWQEALRPFQSLVRDHGQHPRVSFSIRPEVDAYFARQLHRDPSGQPGNSRIIDALARIRSFQDGFDERRSAQGQPLDFNDFTRFVYEQVQLVLTRVPAHTDLNKLFEVINNRGVQLQHHQILKAKMLAFLSNDSGERDHYATLWDACSHMENYVEKNLRDIGAVRIASLFDNASAQRGGESLARATSVLDALREKQQSFEKVEPLDLDAILALPEIPDASGKPTDPEPYEARQVRSIISFPMLLQHTLRIWLHREGREDIPRILDKELLDLFTRSFFTGTTTADDVSSFIWLLWETRYCFDKHIIKWVTLDQDEQHAVCRLYLNTSDGSTSLQRRRPESNEAFALLQSMLYHSQQITTHYWLTPLLSYLLKNPGTEGDHRLDYLRQLDNLLFTSTDDRPLVARSNDFLRDPDHKPQLVDIAAVLASPDGVHFPHYWFYKLEFILWHGNHLGLSPAELSAFRMTAKNSIEHISPQTAQGVDLDTVSPEVLDSFGNLALVSRGLNSEYGNKPYNEKRQHFLNHNRDRIDSLKMVAIYRNAKWGDEEAREHEREMVALLVDYLGKSHFTP
jgi:hypothetical protein